MVRSGLFVFLCFVSVCGFADTNKKNVQSTQDWERREILISPDELAENISRSIEQGRWRQEDFNGSLVFLLTDHDSGANKLYVQWVDETTNEVTYSISIREFNVSPEYALELPKCISDDCAFSKIKALHVFEGREQVFTLNLVGLGRYRVGVLAD